MTGVEVKAKYETYIDEVGSGYIDDTRLNDLFFKADNNIITKLVDEYGLTQRITRDMLPIILETAPITPIASTIDISATSVTVPNYYSLALLTVVSPYLNRTISKVAKERPFDQFQSNYTIGVARYPRYYFTANTITLEPANVISAQLVYFRKAILIDVTDNITQVPYNDEYVLQLISWVIDMAGFMGRDQFLMMASQVDKQREK